MHRHLVPTLLPHPHSLELDKQAAHHMIHVLRAKVGEYVILFDGHHYEAEAQITAIHKDTVTLDIKKVDPLKVSPFSLTMMIAALKPNRTDWLVEKLSEIGVTRLLWIQCERSQASSLMSAEKRSDRWERLLEAASKQSGRTTLMQIDGPQRLEQVLAETKGHAFLAAPHGKDLAHVITPLRTEAEVCLLVGPEGGFTSTELSQIEKAGYTGLYLGPHILRVETAAIVGAGALMALRYEPV